MVHGPIWSATQNTLVNNTITRNRNRIGPLYSTIFQIWGVGDEPAPDSDDDGGASALDLDPEAQAVLEMMGKTFVSKNVKAEDAQKEKEKLDEKKRKEEEEEKEDEISEG
jgi:hypothetical protein